jgi:malonate-semialdehyde dehydrogenase (acetylating)/methylmalonate-semialdehyde dehydrogenase
MAELLHEAGLPKGVLNVLHGDKVAVDGLLTHPEVEAVNRLTTRMHRDDTMAGDALHGRVRAWLGDRRPLDAAADRDRGRRNAPCCIGGQRARAVRAGQL